MKTHFGIIVVALAAITAVITVTRLPLVKVGVVSSAGAAATIPFITDKEFAPGEIVALRGGFFEREKLDIEMRRAGSLDEVMSMVSATGGFGVTDSISFLLARDRGLPIVAFAAGQVECPVVFYSLEKSKIHSPKDFAGKRIGRQSGRDTAIIYDAMLRALSISRSDTRETAEADIDALIKEKVDVVPGHLGIESFMLQRRAASYNPIQASDYGIHVPGTVYFTSKSTIERSPSTVLHFLRGIIAGWTSTYADVPKSVALVTSARGNVTAKQVEFEIAAQRGVVLPLGRRLAEFDDGQWKQLRLILMNARLIDDSLDLSKAVNLEFLKEVYRKPISFGN